ncbi:MAG: GNAT family N-acetyltransferase, partial [Anaerolineaceae bacterium]|nr:GNAT family N-acetyltransferase [Anaerolineaceae bacterium]
RTAVPEDLDAVAAVEAACFPPAEAASREQLAERLKYYASHFLLLFVEGRLVSFVDGFVTDESDLTDEMYEKAEMHNENGRWQMIFGVNTVPACRGKGCAGMLIRRMVSDAKEQGRDGLVLTCKDALVPYYAKFGFVSEGHTSKFTHGGAVWNQMRLRFEKADRKKGTEMKGLYFDGEKAVYREDLPMPRCEDGQSLIRILYADICSTDREILKGYRPDFRGIMGHEFVGVVAESSEAELVGKTVVGELNEGCGHCIYCRTGREKHCLSRKVIGMSKDGCFAEYMTLATRLLHVVPEGLAPEQAVFTEPLAAAVEILRQVHIDPSLSAAVIGDGRLACMIAQVLAQTGISLTVIGKHPEKLKLFEPFAKTVLLSDYFSGGRYRSLSGEECFEYVAEASGNESGIRLALHITRKMGTIILKSTYAGETSINLSEIPVCEFTVVGSRCGPFDPALKLLSEGKVSFPDVEFYDLKDFRKAFSSGAFKAGFSFK